jgi:di/tricarboxylate transporter
VKWDVIVTIAAAFGISAAMEQSGVAGAIAATLVEGGKNLGTGAPGVLIAVYIATFLLCNVVGGAGRIMLVSELVSVYPPQASHVQFTSAHLSVSLTLGPP